MAAKRYLTSNLWDSFKEDCPISSIIPFFRMWAFGCYTRGYFEKKLPFSER